MKFLSIRDERLLQLSADNNVLTIDVSEDVSGKAELLEKIASAGHFPEYFGGNWDALEELLTDMSWVKEKTILFRQLGRLDKLNTEDLTIYFNILESVGLCWSTTAEKSFQAVLSERCAANYNVRAALQKVSSPQGA